MLIPHEDALDILPVRQAVEVFDGAVQRRNELPLYRKSGNPAALQQLLPQREREVLHRFEGQHPLLVQPLENLPRPELRLSPFLHQPFQLRDGHGLDIYLFDFLHTLFVNLAM